MTYDLCTSTRTCHSTTGAGCSTLSYRSGTPRPPCTSNRTTPLPPNPAHLAEPDGAVPPEELCKGKKVCMMFEVCGVQYISRKLSQPHQKASVFGSNSLTAPRSTASLSECSQSRMRPHERNTITRARARFSARFFSHSQAFRNRPLWCLLGQPAFSVW